MNLVPLYKVYGLLFNGAGCLLNLFMVGLFLYACRIHPTQRAFPIFVFSSFCFAFTTAYLFVSSINHYYSLDLFSFPAWRILAYIYFVAQPLGFISCLVGPVVLVRTYGRAALNSSK